MVALLAELSTSMHISDNGTDRRMNGVHTRFVRKQVYDVKCRRAKTWSMTGTHRAPTKVTKGGLDRMQFSN